MKLLNIISFILSVPSYSHVIAKHQNALRGTDDNSEGVIIDAKETEEETVEVLTYPFEDMTNRNLATVSCEEYSASKQTESFIETSEVTKDCPSGYR